jgi:hypothetical protein
LQHHRLGDCPGRKGDCARLYDAALGDPDWVVLVAGAAGPGPARRGGDRLCRPCPLHEPGPCRLGRRSRSGNTLLLLAAILWAVGSCLYRRHSWRSPFWVQTFWQLAVSIAPAGAIGLTGAASGPVHCSPGLIAVLAYNRIARRRDRLVQVEKGGAAIACVFITGSSHGLGLMAAKLLIEQGHEVVVHGRNEGRSRDALLAAVGAQGAVTGDLSTIAGATTAVGVGGPYRRSSSIRAPRHTQDRG